MPVYSKAEARDWAREKVRGQWTTCMTPFTVDDKLDEQALRANIDHVRQLGTRGAGFSWGMGEFWSLTTQERMRLFDVAADAAKGKLLTAAHVTHNAASEMLSLADHANAAGMDLLIVTAPAIGAKTEDQVVDYVRLLASHTPMAVIYYNTPQFGLVLSVEGLQKVCAIPNVVGVKEASFNQELSIEAHKLLGAESIISTPDEWILFKGQELGFTQQVMFANTSDWRFDQPGKNYYVQFIDKATEGDIDRQFYDLHLAPMKELSDKWWGYTVKKFGGTLPVALCKHWGELMGLKHGSVRPPLKDLDAEEKRRLADELKSMQNTLAA